MQVFMLIDGTKIASTILSEIKDQLHRQYSDASRPPCLAVILVGHHAPSQIYVHRKAEACRETGIFFILNHFEEHCSEEELLAEIRRLNQNPAIDGILVQLPLPTHINAKNVLQTIHPDKDVDGCHPVNMGKLLLGDQSAFVPCTPLGIQQLLLRSQVQILGKHVVIVGRSNLVGKPLAALLMQNSLGGNGSVTVLHSLSERMGEICRSADILIAAVGQPDLITADFVCEGTVVVDVGINKIPADNAKGFRIVGDVAFDDVAPKCSLITPVPGGVGPMTIAMLISNTFKSFARWSE
jgi:methylenetetrahydrofolate dehydrogenase (NADP+)/methenyltetrahydrofolate cyclohydrolase